MIQPCTKTSDQQICMPMLARRSGFSWPLVTGALAFLVVIARGSFTLIDGDTYWHLATGRWIAENLAVPHADMFSHTLQGAPWTAHEWLSEVLLYLAFEAGGWTAVVTLGAVAFSVAIACLTRFLLGYLAPVRALLFSVLATGMAIPHLLARPHLLAIPCLVIWCAGLIRANDERRSPPLWLLGIMIVWANLHGGFTLGLALAVTFGMEAMFQAERIERIAVTKRWLVFLGFAFLASMLTPHGFQGILFTAKVMGMTFSQENIGEWLSPDFHKFQFLELWLMLLLAVALTKGLRLAPMRLLVLLALIHLGLAHVRNVELIGFLSPLLLAAPLAVQWPAAPARSERTERVNGLFRSLAAPARLPAITIVLGLLGAVTLLKTQQDDIHPAAAISPAAAVSAVKTTGIAGPVFNDYGFGGYLIFSGIPVFIDGRTDLYGDAFLKQYMMATNLVESDALTRLLEQYHIRWTLLAPHTPAVALLDHLPQWRRFYADGVAVVHVRTMPY